VVVVGHFAREEIFRKSNIDAAIGARQLVIKINSQRLRISDKYGSVYLATMTQPNNYVLEGAASNQVSASLDRNFS
jgi:hypothetical protein